jgi:hypothetical protein
VDYVLAWIAMEDDGVRSKKIIHALPSNKNYAHQARIHLLRMLSRNNKSLEDIIRTLQTYYDNVDEDEAISPDKPEGTGRASLQREILQNLMSFLKSC